MDSNKLRIFPLLFIAFGLLFDSGAYAAKARYYEYFSQPGDSLSDIAKRFLIKERDWHSLQKRNRLPDSGPVKPGSSIRIPIAAIRVEPAPAEVIAVNGPVTSNVGKITRGRVLGEGSQIDTGANGFVAIRLTNGSMLKIQPNSRLSLETLRQLVDTAGIPDYVIQLQAGRVEVEATNLAVATVRFQLRTPLAHVIVSRGTFRLAADLAGNRALAEVVEGVENFQRNSKYKPEVLTSGFAAYADAVTPPDRIEMLASPDLAGVKNAGANSVARFQFPVLPAATAYRAQIATDAAFTNMIASATALKPEFEFHGLPDAALFLRLRGISADGLEGKDASLAFQLNEFSSTSALVSAPALPAVPAVMPIISLVPPSTLPAAPDLAGVRNTSAGALTRFQFPALPEAEAYIAQIATDAAFTDVIASAKALSPDIEFNGLPEGRLYMRVRGIAADGREGKDALLVFQSLALPPAQPTSKTRGAVQLPTGQVVFDWDAVPEAAGYRLQVSRSALFAELSVDQPVGLNMSFVLEKPLDAGEYFWRIAAENRAGKPGAYSDTRRFKIRRAPAKLMVTEMRGGEARFSWAGVAGEDYQFQLSRNERFTDIVVDRTSNKPEVVVNDLGKNVYFMRVRQIEQSGAGNDPYTGSWSEILQVEIYGSNWWLLLFGLPVL